MIKPADPGRWAALCAEFDALAELDPGARASRLAAIGDTDPAARAVLEELLEADATPASGLDRLDAIFGIADPPRVEPSADRDLLKLVGQTVAHFRVVEPLASGGMGVVYRAFDTHLSRPVALKFPLPGQRLDGQVRERFVREARAAAALDHPNICSIYETGEAEDGQLFLAMPLYQGETLKARIARAGPLAIPDALRIAEQIARGLNAAHRAGIVHRDLKPANVMLLPEGEVKILDFGVARVADATLTKSRDTLGTVSYMAPEQVRGDPLDGRADLWALGVLLYEMSTGRRPFEGPHEIAVAHAILHARAPRPSTLRAEIGVELDALVLGLLAREPDRRPASAEAVAAELDAMESRPTTARQGLRRLRFTNRRALVSASIFVLVAAAGAAAWLLRPGVGAGPTAPRIVAVLPFADSAGHVGTDYLAAALPHEIAARLSGLSAVAVSADSAGAAAVVRGVVRRSGDEVLLRINLFDAARKETRWTHEYRGPVDAGLRLERSATDGIVEALDLDVSSDERAALADVSTAKPEAYDLFLRGRAAQIGAAPDDSSQRWMESLQRAQSYYMQARASDPGFAAPRAGLATLHLALARHDQVGARREQARIEAEAALRLRPGMPEAHEALAAYWALRGETQNAITEVERAVVGRPNAGHLYFLMASYLWQFGRLEEAAGAFERAARLAPRDIEAHSSAALTYSRLRQYPGAIRHWDQVIALDSSLPFPQIIRGFCYLRNGNLDSLDAAISRIPLGRDPRGLTIYAHYTAHAVRRRHAEALASLDSARSPIVFDGPPGSVDGLLYRPIVLLRALTLERMGDSTNARSAYVTAKSFLEDSVAAHPKAASMRVALGISYAGLGRKGDAIREAHAAIELFPVSEHSSTAAAHMGGAVEIYARLGETDAALELIELLLSMPAGREVSVPLLRLDPTFDPLRADPRFEALLARFSGS